MKLKNISLVELHVEKLVLALGAVFFLGVIWLYAIFPTKVEVKVGAQTDFAGPGAIGELISAQADTLRRKLKNDSPPDSLEKWKSPPVAESLRQQLVSTSNSQKLSVALGQRGVDFSNLPELDDNSGTPQHYAVPELPMPDAPSARADFAMLAPGGDQTPLQQEWLNQLKLSEPGDFRYVSIATAFDMPEWQRRLQQGPNQRIPEDWWKSQLLATQVILERQTLLDPATGTWSDPVAIPRIPTQTAFKSVQAELASDQTASLLLRIRARQTSILRPRIEPIIVDRAWYPPTIEPDKMLPKLREQARTLLQALRDLDAKSEAQVAGTIEFPEEEGLTANTVPTAGTYAPPPTDAGYMGGPPPGYEDDMGPPPGFMGGPPGGMPGYPGMMPGYPGPTAMPSSPVVLNPTDDVATQTEELQKKLKSVLEGKDISLDPAATTTAATPTAPTGPTVIDVSRLANKPTKSSAKTVQKDITKLPVTVHDVTIEPGKTYRYRVKVAVFNPLFRKNQVEPNQHKEMFDRLGLESPASAWTAPVAIPPERYYFLISAVPDQRSSRWEVWRIFHAHWVKQEFNVHPGDPIGGTLPVKIEGMLEPVPLDMSVPVALVDVQAGEKSAGSNERAVVMDLQTGNLLERVVGRDRDDPDRKDILESIPKMAPPPQQPAAAPTANTPPYPGGRRPGGMPPGMEDDGPPPGAYPGGQPSGPTRRPTPTRPTSPSRAPSPPRGGY